MSHNEACLRQNPQVFGPPYTQESCAKQVHSAWFLDGALERASVFHPLKKLVQRQPCAILVTYEPAYMGNESFKEQQILIG